MPTERSNVKANYTDFKGPDIIFLDLDETKTIHISGGEKKFEILPIEEFMNMIELLRFLNTRRDLIQDFIKSVTGVE